MKDSNLNQMFDHRIAIAIDGRSMIVFCLRAIFGLLILVSFGGTCATCQAQLSQEVSEVF